VEPDRNTSKFGPGGTTLEFTATKFRTRREAQNIDFQTFISALGKIVKFPTPQAKVE